MRLIKGVAFYLIFTSLCVVVVLSSMRYLAARSGREELYDDWREEIDDALEEARLFLAETYEKGRQIVKGQTTEVKD